MSPRRQQQPRSSHQTKEDDRTPYSLKREASRTLEERIQALVAEMRTCLAEKRPVNLSNPPHIEITEALHRIVYDKMVDPAELDVIYNDTLPEKRRTAFPIKSLTSNSTSHEKVELDVIYNDILPDERRAAYPIRSLSSESASPRWQSEKAQSNMFNIGTLSFRHVAYDDYVDLYLMRDRETRTMTSLEIQQEAFCRMTGILDDPALAEESYVSIYQTGLEPLVVGVYCAVVHHLMKRKDKGLPPLFIWPVYYANGRRRTVSRTYWAREYLGWT